jgi:hypothetical protein
MSNGRLKDEWNRTSFLIWAIAAYGYKRIRKRIKPADFNPLLQNPKPHKHDSIESIKAAFEGMYGQSRRNKSR